jgi:hypothetical protein
MIPLAGKAGVVLFMLLKLTPGDPVLIVFGALIAAMVLIGTAAPLLTPL